MYNSSYAKENYFNSNNNSKNNSKNNPVNPCTDFLSDKDYLVHMIPHHQVAIDMSKVLLMNTKSDMMIYIAYRIIRSQNAEIIILNDFLKKSTYRHKSELLN